MKYSKALEAATLSQYAISAAFMERFIDAIHSEGTEITRSANEHGIKLVDGREMSADALNYFSDQADKLKDEFFSELTARIGRASAIWFCDVISRDWYDGRGLRNADRVLSLKKGVKNYLAERLPRSRPIEQIVQKAAILPCRARLTANQIATVLQINHEMLTKWMEGWKAVHPQSSSMSSDDIYIRRGLSLRTPIPDGEEYIEWDYINSYSLAFSAPEKFAQMVDGQVPAMINGDLALFERRILFFSPFVPGMEIGQLEFGVIPAFRPEPLKAQGEFGGIHEYVLSPIQIDLA